MHLWQKGGISRGTSTLDPIRSMVMFSKKNGRHTNYSTVLVMQKHTHTHKIFNNFRVVFSMKLVDSCGLYSPPCSVPLPLTSCILLNQRLAARFFRYIIDWCWRTMLEDCPNKNWELEILGEMSHTYCPWHWHILTYPASQLLVGPDPRRPPRRLPCFAAARASALKHAFANFE